MPTETEITLAAVRMLNVEGESLVVLHRDSGYEIYYVAPGMSDPIMIEAKSGTISLDGQHVYDETGMDSPAKQQIGRLAEFIMDEIEGEPSQPEGAVDTAIRLLRSSHQASTEKDTP